MFVMAKYTSNYVVKPNLTFKLLELYLIDDFIPTIELNILFWQAGPCEWTEVGG